mgnify:CR=1 FL=1
MEVEEEEEKKEKSTDDKYLEEELKRFQFKLKYYKGLKDFLDLKISTRY